MKQFTLLAAIQLCLCVCIVTADQFCPPGFENVEGISEHRCFNYHLTPANVKTTTVNFADALKICERKNAKVFEPKSHEEGNAISKFLQEKHKRFPSFWINYHDIQDQKILLGVKYAVLLNSPYMGSLSTFDKMPIEWWDNTFTNKGGKRNKGFHCAFWWKTDGVRDGDCSYMKELICETHARPNLLKPRVSKTHRDDVATIERYQ